MADENNRMSSAAVKERGQYLSRSQPGRLREVPLDVRGRVRVLDVPLS